MHSEDLSTCRYWKEYGTASNPFGAEIDLTEPNEVNGRGCRQVIMLEAGELHLRMGHGSPRIIETSLAAGTVLPLEAVAILSTQTAKILVLW